MGLATETAAPAYAAVETTCSTTRAPAATSAIAKHAQVVFHERCVEDGESSRSLYQKKKEKKEKKKKKRQLKGKKEGGDDQKELFRSRTPGRLKMPR